LPLTSQSRRPLTYWLKMWKLSRMFLSKLVESESIFRNIIIWNLLEVVSKERNKSFQQNMLQLRKTRLSIKIVSFLITFFEGGCENVKNKSVSNVFPEGCWKHLKQLSLETYFIYVQTSTLDENFLFIIKSPLHFSLP